MTYLKKDGISALLSILTVFLMLSACATNPVTKKKEFVLMSEQQEFSTGKKLDPEIRKQYGVYTSIPLQSYVTSVGERLAKVSDRPDILFHFTVLNSPVVNAFALPGGYIYITRGLMAYINTEAELAAVLAHETGHVTARHAVRQYTKTASYQILTGIASILVPETSNFHQFSDFVFMAVNSGYSRDYEFEADRLSVKYTARSGYSPESMQSVLHKLELIDRCTNGPETHMNIFASHPETNKRILMSKQAILTNPGQIPPNPVTNQQQYLKAIDGITFGPDVHQGVISGNIFKHPDLRIEIVFPKGWTIQNMSDAVIARSKTQNLLIELQHQSISKTLPLNETAYRISKNAGFIQINSSHHYINGIDTYTGIYEKEDTKALLAFYRIQANIYIVAGTCKRNDFKEALPYFKKTIYSFQKMSKEDAVKIKPDHIHLYTVKKGQTLRSIIEKLGRPEKDIKSFALINGWDPASIPPLKPGMLIKIITSNN